MTGTIYIISKRDHQKISRTFMITINPVKKRCSRKDNSNNKVIMKTILNIYEDNNSGIKPQIKTLVCKRM